MMNKNNTIADCNEIERELKEAEERYRALFEEAPLGVVLIDPETMAFIEFNDIAHRQLGYSREDLSKLTILQLVAKDQGDEVKSRMAKIMTDGAAEFESKHCTKNGEVRNVLVTARTVDLPAKNL